MFTVRSTVKTITAHVKPTQQLRYKRDKAGLNPQLERIVNQLSVMSAARKQPRLLKLCDEDYIKHRTVMKAWSLYRKNKIEHNESLLEKQYQSMNEAAAELQSINPKLYEIANEHQFGKRFPLEIRTPTDFPPRQIWFYDYFPKVDGSKQQ
ncbi:39S ribosomal protein L28, mitochondrial [Pichia californica]|uniref:Large ribosomal subunit protein mL40 n=1 Tax=Pichia californica TaxID=460514 RepID=A0A9P6WQ64_9ASCO|nr:39S ribosomal protein L28, mitochondrial [[Candida] californica]KAG0690118.1 39S ribosomal protein L28, mitochondrial [[Candida] californica]